MHALPLFVQNNYRVRISPGGTYYAHFKKRILVTIAAVKPLYHDTPL